MARLAKVLKDFTLFIDGVGYAGRVTEATPPKLVVKTEEFRAGGMDAPIELDMGQETPTLEATLAEYDPVLYAQWGLSEGHEVGITLRGSQGHGPAEEPVMIVARGMVKEVDSGSLKTGEKTECKLTLSCAYYRVVIAGLPVIEIDVINARRVVGGADQLAARRQNLGLE